MTLTALPLRAPAEDWTAVGASRWRPERAGIVNVWRYFDETFSFHRGRLLLRGPNGTGKSKALELLLPYLLDASLRPSRLSTFGGQERTMHWNLMGGGYDGKFRVGYVWVEFARPGDQGREWFTVGARLQASVNTRGVTASYFTTDQRVGMPDGLALLGDGNRPRTRAALEEAIGAHGRVFDAAGDYRREVMHTLFRGFDPDKYEALIFALLQLRTPKLSEHLDPDELSTVLSRALPPLDQQAVAEIAEGFEKLDRRREDLAQLEQDVAVATRLADRQRRYAQRAVRAAAGELISATTRMDDVTRRARESRGRHDATVAAQRELEDADHRLDEEALAKDARRQALQDSDAYRQGAELDRLRQEVDRQRRQAAAARGQAERAVRDVTEDRGRLDDAVRDVQHLHAARDRAAGGLQRAATRVGLEAVWEEAAGCDPDRARGLLAAAGDARDRQVGEVRAALAAHQRSVAERRAAEQRLERSREELEAAETVAADRRRDRGEAATRLGDRVHDWAAGCNELPVADRAEQLAGLIEDESAVLTLVHTAAQEVTGALAEQEAGLRTRHREAIGARDLLVAERARLEAVRDLPPVSPPSRTADRARRPGAPLWRLVAFDAGVDESTQAAMEAALSDAGLLDAWVLPDGSVAPDDGHDRFADADLSTPAPAASLADVLVCEPDATVPAPQVRRLLTAVAWGPTAPHHPAAIGADGTWRLATLTGSWSKPLAEFIGATARQRARQRRLAELSGRIAELDAELAAFAAELDGCRIRRTRLDAELRARPSHAPLRRADEALARADAAVATRADAARAPGTSTRGPSRRPSPRCAGSPRSRRRTGCPRFLRRWTRSAMRCGPSVAPARRGSTCACASTPPIGGGTTPRPCSPARRRPHVMRVRPPRTPSGTPRRSSCACRRWRPRLARSTERCSTRSASSATAWSRSPVNVTEWPWTSAAWKARSASCAPAWRSTRTGVTPPPPPATRPRRASDASVCSACPSRPASMRTWPASRA
jgi:uncharacterized protein (TIGR02680 family)